MKILHTSDLHLGHIWWGLSRWNDQMRVLDEVLDLCDQHDVDMLLVAGDVFSHRVQGRHEATARALLERLTPMLKRGRAVFLLRGNHDPYALFSLMSVLVQEMAGNDRWPLVVAAEPAIYRVPRHNLQVIALPYVSPTSLATRTFDPAQDPNARVADLASHLGACLEWLYQQVDPAVPAIFTAHVTVRGASLTPEVEAESGYHREMLLDPARLPQFTSYNALGHIHLTQPIPSAGKPTWYSGAPDRVDLGERAYTPRVLLVETPDMPGGEASVRELPVTTSTPFVREIVQGTDAVSAFCASVGRLDPLGEVEVHGIEAAARGVVEAQIRQVAPRLRIKWQIETPASAVEAPRHDPMDVRGFVRAYLADAYTGPEQAGRRQRLELAFDELLQGTEVRA